MRKSGRRQGLYRVSIEYRYKRHKLSAETRHYEVLFGVIETIGEYDDKTIYDAINKCINEKYRKNLLDSIRLGKNVRIYISGEDLGEILAVLDREDWKPVPREYDYVLVLEHLD